MDTGNQPSQSQRLDIVASVGRAYTCPLHQRPSLPPDGRLAGRRSKRRGDHHGCTLVMLAQAETVAAPIWAYLVFNETTTPAVIVGPQQDAPTSLFAFCGRADRSSLSFRRWGGHSFRRPDAGLRSGAPQGLTGASAA
jgi:hypothetical protein